jgi:hypothetical protein
VNFPSASIRCSFFEKWFAPQKAEVSRPLENSPSRHHGGFLEVIDVPAGRRRHCADGVTKFGSGSLAGRLRFHSDIPNQNEVIEIQHSQ